MPRGAKSKSEAVPPSFPAIHTKLQPPLEAMDAKAVAELPAGNGWQYEPKWDGFRALVFRDRETVIIQSKAGQPLDRYFPELVTALQSLPDQRFVVDGEIVIDVNGALDFDALLQRIHPAASRIKRLSAETPAQLRVFDLLEDGTQVFSAAPLRLRREVLENWSRLNLESDAPVRLSPCSLDLSQAARWLTDLTTSCDGVVAKLREEPYHFGDRRGMVKVKRIRTADCVVAGFRYASKGDAIGSLLLGLYNEEGKLDHVGFTSSFTAEERAELEEKIAGAVPQPGQEAQAGFSGNAPGGPSRWNAYNPRASEWKPLLPKLVVEVSYDHFSGGRFRHGTKLPRWRPDKRVDQCTKEQIAPMRKSAA